jgi:hypothetical protein
LCGIRATTRKTKSLDNKALDAEPPTASFVKSMLIGGGPVNAADCEVLGLASEGRHCLMIF